LLLRLAVGVGAISLLRRRPVGSGRWRAVRRRATGRRTVRHGRALRRRTVRPTRSRPRRGTERRAERSRVRGDGPAERVDPGLRNGRRERCFVRHGTCVTRVLHARRGTRRSARHRHRGRGLGRLLRSGAWRRPRRREATPAHGAGRRSTHRRSVAGEASDRRRDADHRPLEAIGSPRSGPDRTDGARRSGRRCTRRGGGSALRGHPRRQRRSRRGAGLIHHQHRALELGCRSALQLEVALGTGRGRVGVLRATVRTEHSPPRKSPELPLTLGQRNLVTREEHSGSRSAASREFAVQLRRPRAPSRASTQIGAQAVLWRLDTGASSPLAFAPVSALFARFSKDFPGRARETRASSALQGPPQRCPSS
jgi:hypothetical protein